MNKSNKLFNAFILIGMFATVAWLNVKEFSKPDVQVALQIVISIGALAGVVNTVLSANGSIWNYLFGLIDVLATIVVCFFSSIHNGNPIWGQFALHLLFFLPMQFVGIWQWRKHGASSSKQVRPERLTPAKWGICALGLLLLIAGMYAVLNFAGNENPQLLNKVILLDAVVTSLCIVGQILMVFAFADQWFIWIAVNVSAILLYFFKSRSSDADAYTIVYMFKYIFYFINSLNGLRIWLSLSQIKDDKVAE